MNFQKFQNNSGTIIHHESCTLDAYHTISQYYTMPRFFDDYSNTYLTHDSSAGRKQQRRGWKFRENFRLHYQEHVPEWRRGEMGLASAQQAYIRARGKDDPAIPPLPEGWKEEVDDVTGITYYIDNTTKKRTWVRPGFIPPPPGGARHPPPGAFRGRAPPPGGGGAYMNQGAPPPGVPPPFNPQQQAPPPPSVGTASGYPPAGQHQAQHQQQQPPPPPMQNLPPPPTSATAGTAPPRY